MLSFTTTALLAFGILGASASPMHPPPRRQSNTQQQCMTTAEAQQVADNYSQLIRNFTVGGAEVSLAPDFTDYSESVNTLINSCPQGSAAITLPLLAPTFTNRTAFIAGQSQQPNINFEQLGIWSTCDTVIIRWTTNNTAPPQSNPKPVVGIIIIEATPAPAGNMYPWLVQTVYSEFDAGVWLQNLERAGICSSSSSSSGSGSSSAAPTVPIPTSAAPSASATGGAR